MPEENEIIRMLKGLTETLPAFTDLYFLVFVQYRNLVTGANTITKSGLTSPGSGLVQEWPNIGPNGKNVSYGSPGGGTTPLVSQFQSQGGSVTSSDSPPTSSAPVTTYKGWKIYAYPGSSYTIWNGTTTAGPFLTLILAFQFIDSLS